MKKQHLIKASYFILSNSNQVIIEADTYMPQLGNVKLILDQNGQTIFFNKQVKDLFKDAKLIMQDQFKKALSLQIKGKKASVNHNESFFKSQAQLCIDLSQGRHNDVVLRA